MALTVALPLGTLLVETGNVALSVSFISKKYVPGTTPDAVVHTTCVPAVAVPDGVVHC
jgi:uridine phosphorylase